MPSLDLDFVGRWCNQLNLRFHRVEPTRIQIPQVGKNHLDFAFVLDPQRSMLVLVVAMPAEVHVERSLLARAANRVNAATRIGSMVVPDTGDAFFRITVPTKGFEADDEGLKYVFDLALGTVDEVLPRYQRVATGEVGPEQLFS